MNLKLVTFEIDYTQFLVDEIDNDKALEAAIEANKSNFLGDWDPEEITETGMFDPGNYTIEEVNDMNMLAEIVRRDDYCGIINGVIVLNG